MHAAVPYLMGAALTVVGPFLGKPIGNRVREAFERAIKDNVDHGGKHVETEVNSLATYVLIASWSRTASQILSGALGPIFSLMLAIAGKHENSATLLVILSGIAIVITMVLFQQFVSETDPTKAQTWQTKRTVAGKHLRLRGYGPISPVGVVIVILNLIFAAVSAAIVS